MSIAIGSKSRLYWTPETSYAVAPSGAVWKGLLFSTESLVENINKIQSEDIRADRTQPSIRAGNIAVGGSISNDFGLSRFGIWMQHLLCADSATTYNSTVSVGVGGSTAQTTLSNGPVYSATNIVRGQALSATTGLFIAVNSFSFTTPGSSTATAFAADVASAVVGQTVTLATSSTSGLGQVMCIVPVGTATPSFYMHSIQGGITKPTGGLCIEKQILGGTSPLYVAFQGCRINTLSLSFAQQAIVKAQWGILGTTTVASSSGSIDATGTGYAYPTDDPFTGYDTFISLNNGTTIRPFKSLSLDITNNFDESVYQLSSQYRLDLPEGKRMITLKAELYFDNLTEYNYFKNQTVVPVTINTVHDKGCQIFTMPEARLTGAGTPVINGQGVVTASFDLSVYHQNGAYDIQYTAFSEDVSLV